MTYSRSMKTYYAIVFQFDFNCLKKKIKKNQACWFRINVIVGISNLYTHNTMKSSIIYLSTGKCTFCYVYYNKIERENQILMAFICMWIKQLLSLLNNQVANKSVCLVEQELPTLTQHLNSPPPSLRFLVGFVLLDL